MLCVFQNIDGHALLALTKEQIVNLTGMKVGPSLKIYDLIQALKIRVSQQGHQVVPVYSTGGSTFPSPTTTSPVKHSSALQAHLTEQSKTLLS